MLTYLMYVCPCIVV